MTLGRVPAVHTRTPSVSDPAPIRTPSNFPAVRACVSTGSLGSRVCQTGEALAHLGHGECRKRSCHSPCMTVLAVKIIRNIAALMALALLCPAEALALDPAKALTQFTHSAWLMEDGLPQNSIKAIAQTADGYLWLATQAGLVRFDGVRFTVFNTANTPALININVMALLAARDGSLWIGTYGGGVTRLKDGTFTTYTTRDGLAHDVVF